MKKHRYLALFSLSLILVLLAPATVVFRIAQAQAQEKRNARDNFARLTALLAPVAQAADLAAPGLRKDLERFYASSPGLLLVSVYERGSGVKWRIPARSDYLPARENVAVIPQPIYPPQSAYLLAAPLASDSSGQLAVDALYVALPQETVFVAFRDAALGLAILLVLLFGVLILSPSSPKRSEDEDQGVCAEDENLPGCDPETMYVAPMEDDFSIPDLAPDSGLNLPREEAIGAQSQVTAEAGPGGLFSPLSGLGWESYLDARLDSELSRSASFEQDLSLLLILHLGISPGQGAYKALSNAIGDFFSFRDLAFERGPDGFAVILPNMDAEHGLRMAEEFLRKATALLGPGSGPNPIYMGLSSRAGRLVDASRLGHEAGAALERARSEADSHIVAFRPDPDRYRIYLASKNL